MAVNSLTSSTWSAVSAVALTTFAVSGSTGSIAATSSSSVVPSIAATEIASYWPSRSRSSCAAGIVKTAKLAFPRLSRLPYCATPTSSNVRFGWRVEISTVSPTA